MTKEEAIRRIKAWNLDADDMEVLSEVIPELKESEKSEDERIRKALIDGVRQIRCKNGITQEQMLAYLEKQKESEDVSASTMIPSCWEVEQKERGPLTKEEEYTLHRIIEYLEDEACPSEWISLLHDIYCLPYEKQKEYGEANFREGYLHGFEDAQKEQKPVPINSDDKYMLERTMALIEFCDDKEIIWSWLCEKVKVATQKPAEWSEEDRNRVAEYLHDRDGGMLWSKATEITSDILDILHPQSKDEIYKEKNEDVEKLCSNEWSEEDERIRKDLIKYLESDRDCQPCQDVSFYDSSITWLEKQKVNTEGDFKRGYDCGYQAGYAVAVNEMKPKVATATLATVTLDSEKKKDNKFAPRVLPCSAAWFEDGEDNEQKEQKPNHDKEKLIKHCIGMILTDATEKRFKDYGLTLKDCLTWLSVQKEQKPAESISHLTVQGKGFYKICPRCKERMVRDDSKVYTSMPPQYGYECPKCGEIEFDTTMYDNPEMEEQKPVRDIVPGDAIESCMLRYLQSAANRNDDIGIIEDTKTYKSELISLIEKEQKPAEVTINGEPIPTKNQSVDIPLVEWSKEDEKMLLSIIYDFRKGAVSTIGQEQWLKSLPKRFNLQPKNEWSEDYREEDIQTRFAFYTYKDDPSTLYLSNVFVEEASRNHHFGTRILSAAEKVAETIGATTISLKVRQDSPANTWYRKNGYGYVTFEDGYDWLEKNLECTKPSNREWSEEDEKMQKDIIQVLKSYIFESNPPLCGSFPTYYLEKSFSAAKDWLESLPGRFNLQPQPKQEQKEPSDKGEISDGYHTFNELYYYRMIYNAAFFNLLPKEWVHKSKRHHDGEECFGGGWFIVTANLPTGQISNHYEIKDWDLFHIPEKETADRWDGHTPQEAAERLHKFLLEMPDLMPVEYLPKEKVYDIMRKLNMLSLSDIIPFRSEEYNKINEIESEVHDLLNYPIEKKQERKPVEWGEEDEKMRKNIIWVLESFVSQADCESNPSLSTSYPTYYKEIDWFKSLSDRFNLQPQAKEEQKPEAKLTGWVARDREFNPYYGTGLILFREKPQKSYDCWNGDIVTQLPWELFPDLKWVDEPVEVEITIRKK